jgi:hypothetical protein
MLSLHGNPVGTGFAVGGAITLAGSSLKKAKDDLLLARRELVVVQGGEVKVTVVDAGRLPVAIEAWWMELDGHWLATARARPR